MDLAGYAVTVPEGWSADRKSDGPRRIVVLRPPERDAFCQIVVFRDGRMFREDDARALLGDGRAVFRGRDDRALTLSTPEGPMEGFALRDPAPQPEWGVLPPGDRRLEMYAADRGLRLVTAVVATSAGSAEGASPRERCLEAVRTMRMR